MQLKKRILASLVLVFPLGAQAEHITVQVKGMVCAFCAQGIEKKFKALAEIETVKVSLETKKVELHTKEGKTATDEQIKALITEAGYDVVKIEKKP